VQQGCKILTTVCSSSNAALHNSSVRNLERVKEKACGKRQRQPSLDQFLPSHDLIGVWVPARASKRANSKAGAITSPILSICVDRATIHCQHLSPSPPREQPQFTQRGQDHFSLTLSLGSSTEDDCYVDHDQEQQPQDLRDVPSVDQQHELVPWQQPPCQQTPPGKCFVEYTQPVQAFPDPDVTSKAVICRTGFELDRLRVDAGLSSLLSSSSSTVNATVASPASSSLLSCCSAFSPIPSCHSMVDGTAIARNSPSCSDQHPASRSTQSEFSSLQFTDAATPLPHVAPGQVVLGAPPLFPSSPATFSHAFFFYPQRALLCRVLLATLLYFSRHSSVRTARRAVRLRPSFTSSSRSQQRRCCLTNL
jgi:hypothetical protein